MNKWRERISDRREREGVYLVEGYRMRRKGVGRVERSLEECGD